MARAASASRLLAPLITTAFVAMAVPVLANHAQTSSGNVVVFDHVAGNEYWVEVALSGQDAGSVASVEAMDTNGAWTPLQKKSWGPYAASFHIEPGNQVRFRATWAGGAQQVSCWFTHPAGAEQCATTSTTTTTSSTTTTTSPPGAWRTARVGDAGLHASSGDMAISDVDNDGRRDVTFANNRGLFVQEWTGSAWTTELIASLGLGGVAAGDGDGDGRNEVYAMQNNRVDGQTGTTLLRFEKTEAGWDYEPMFGFNETNVGDMTLGNIDGIAGPELYLGLYEGWCDPSAPGYCISNSTVYHVRKTGVSWEATLITPLSGHIDSMWIGDGDNVGGPELYVGHGTRHADRTTQVRSQQGQWVVFGLPGEGSESGSSFVVVGDADRDGKNEVYVHNWYGVLRKLSYDQASGWSAQTLFVETGYSPENLFMGDADSDGTQELYIASYGGELVQVRWSGTGSTGWDLAVIAQPTVSGMSPSSVFLVVGDGDGDGRREAYFAVAYLPQQTDNWDSGFTRVYKVDKPSGAFDATFTGVRGNEWWEQVSVSASGGTLAGVDIRLNGGAWQPMTKQSYGWTKSVRAVQGTVVQFKATSTTGATDLSDCYRWIPPANTDATKVACGGSTSSTTTTATTSTTGSAFDATFSGAKGNDWWVQVSVSGNQAVQNVDARINCSEEWRSLKKESYGWAASFHVPAGSKVDFRAISTTGNMDFSGGYIWPNATPTSGC